MQIVICTFDFVNYVFFHINLLITHKQLTAGRTQYTSMLVKIYLCLVEFATVVVLCVRLPCRCKKDVFAVLELPGRRGISPCTVVVDPM